MPTFNGGPWMTEEERQAEIERYRNPTDADILATLSGRVEIAANRLRDPELRRGVERFGEVIAKEIDRRKNG